MPQVSLPQFLSLPSQPVLLSLIKQLQAGSPLQKDGFTSKSGILKTGSLVSEQEDGQERTQEVEKKVLVCHPPVETTGFPSVVSSTQTQL